MVGFICPVCKLDLVIQDKTYRCDNGHSYDLAKEGYVNLLLVQNKKTKHPGDNRAMLQSRQRFLEAGYYDFLVTELENLFAKLNTNSQLLDPGCGEGFYSHQLSKRLSHNWAAIDIAKPALQLVGKRQYSTSCAVASAYQLPFADHVFDAALSVFSPYSVEELRRVLKPKGYFVAVGPAAQHLNGLAEKVYDDVREHTGNTGDAKYLDQLVLVYKNSIQQQAVVKGSDIFDLLTMTPYYWQCSEEKQQYLSELDELATTLDFEVQVYQCKSE